MRILLPKGGKSNLLEAIVILRLLYCFLGEIDIRAHIIKAAAKNREL